MRQEHGYTLFEMLVTLAILGIVGRIAVYGSAEIYESFKKSDTRYQLDADVRRARNEAVAAGARVILAIANNGKSYKVGVDYAPYSSTGDPDTIVFSRNLPNMVTLTLGQQIIFNSRGYVVDLTGDLVSVTVDLAFNGEAYFSRTLYPTGVMS